MSKNIAVIFGGDSNENEISVITGTMAANVLESGGDTVIPVYVSQNSEIYTGQSLKNISEFRADGYKKAARGIIADGGIYILNARGRVKKFLKVDAALNCCHGGSGEGGGVSGLCKIAKIPFASAGVFESSVFIDKYLTKLILSALGVKTAAYAYVTDLNQLDSCPDIPQFPLIVKPVNLGSSIGVEKVENFEELKNAVECGLIYDSAVILEQYLSGRREINCAAYFYNGEVITSECEESVSGGDILSFEDKYAGGGKSVLPADLPADISGAIKEITKTVYKKLNMRGIVRFDFILSGGEIYLSEVNTVPGSLSYYLLSGGFKDFYRVLSKVIEQAQTDFKTVQGKKLIKTGILSDIPANACKLPRK